MYDLKKEELAPSARHCDRKSEVKQGHVRTDNLFDEKNK